MVKPFLEGAVTGSKEEDKRKEGKNIRKRKPRKQKRLTSPNSVD